MLEQNETAEGIPSRIGRVTASDTQNELLGALGKIFFAVIKVNLTSGKMMVLQSAERPEVVSCRYNWEDYANWYCRTFIVEQDAVRLQGFFSVENMLGRLKEGLHRLSCEVRYASCDGTTDWIEISAYLNETDQGTPIAYFFIRKTSKHHLLKSIISLYVYNNCDYFIYLDAKRNSYEMFSGSTDGTPLPPRYCDDYTSELIAYAEEHVVPEDRAMVIKEMQIDRVLEQLNVKGVHTLYCGVIDPNLGYTRKRLEYRYYDRDAQTILLSRTDVTAMYEEEQSHRLELEAALQQARTDPMTGLLNYQGTMDRVKAMLAQSRGQAALLFIDLDDFKQVNDTMGHAVGDALLCRVAEALQRSIRSTDLLGRVGGDEFVAFLPAISSRAEVEQRAQRLCDAASEVRKGGNDNSFVSCSVGVALFPDDGMGYHELREHADRLAYQAKRDGKNRFCIEREFSER